MTPKHTEEIATFAKANERPEDLGLSIAEGKALLAAVQHQTVVAQVAEWAKRHRCCATCGERRRVKGSYPTTFHTLYGDVELNSPRPHRCACQGVDGPATVSPLRALLHHHVAPERLYLEARWASLIPMSLPRGCWPTSCRSRRARMPRHCASMSCMWPSAQRSTRLHISTEDMERMMATFAASHDGVTMCPPTYAAPSPHYHVAPVITGRR